MHLRACDVLGVTVIWRDVSQNWSAAMDRQAFSWIDGFFRKDRLGQQEGRVALYIREQLGHITHLPWDGL